MIDYYGQAEWEAVFTKCWVQTEAGWSPSFILVGQHTSTILHFRNTCRCTMPNRCSDPFVCQTPYQWRRPRTTFLGRAPVYSEILDSDAISDWFKNDWYPLSRDGIAWAHGISRSDCRSIPQSRFYMDRCESSVWKSRLVPGQHLKHVQVVIVTYISDIAHVTNHRSEVPDKRSSAVPAP